jgi:hypothetical protein
MNGRDRFRSSGRTPHGRARHSPHKPPSPAPMQRLIGASIAVASLLMVTFSVGTAQLPAPAGWTTRSERAATVYVPPDVPSTESYTVAVFSGPSAAPTSREQWLGGRADADVKALLASVVRSGDVRITSPTLSSTSRVIRTSRGVQLIGVYFGVSRGDAQLQLVRVLASSAAMLERYQVKTEELLRAAAAIAPSTAVTPSEVRRDVQAPPQESPPARAPVMSSSPVSNAVNEDVSKISSDMVVKTPAPRRPGIHAGGPLVPGMYVGQQIYSDTKAVSGELTIWLYPTGEYRQQWKRGRQDPREDEFAYDPSTGRIDLAWGSLMQIVNSRIDPDEDFAVIGKTDDGTPVLYAENDRGFTTELTVLLYAGRNDRPSPSMMKAATAAAEAEAARYKHVVAAGQGIQDAQIASIIMHSEMHRTVGLSMQQGVYTTLSIYLLLTDGTIHDGLPVPPDEMDISASRRREPETWGRWRRQGAQVQVAWSVTPNEWKPLDGETMQKARPGEALRGRFSGGESRASGDIGSFSLYGVTFGAGQQFETDSRGGTGTGGFTQTMSGTSVQTTRDDDGSVTSATTPGAVVSSETRNRGSSRAGTYRISGWNLEARYGNGRIVRQPFFFLDEKRDAIYWQGKVVTLNTDTP